jgi:2'-5' RNA ligase
LTVVEPVRDRPRETALSIVVSEADALVAGFRNRFLTHTVARKIPPHVTLLYPFVDADLLDAGLIARLEVLYAPVEPFAFELAHVDRFPAHVWLAPEPRDRFVDLIRLTCAHFPDNLPYGGLFADSEPRPHLTIGEANVDMGIDDLAAEANRTVGPGLPLPCTARTVSLLEEQPYGTWASRAELALAGA